MKIEDGRLKNRYGGNDQLYRQRAFWDGNRSVRLDRDDVGLATTAYSYGLGYEEVEEAAERISLLWNLHLNQSTEELRNLALQAKEPTP